MSNFTVQNMTLIPQSQSNACWFAATQMVVQWRRNKTQSTEMDLRDPSEVPAAVTAHIANNGLLWSSMRQYAQMIGLVPLPLVSPSPELLSSWLQLYGPIWTDGVPVDPNGNTAGTGHVVVISGIRSNNGNTEIQIHDPWPVNRGNVSWRPISHLAGILSDGGNLNRDTFFLRIGL